MAKKKKPQVIIEIENNNKAKITGPTVLLNKLRNSMAVRNPNAFHLRKYMPKGWDGKNYYINEYGKFNVGLTQRVINVCKELKISVDIADFRKGLIKGTVVKQAGDWIGRDYQVGAVEAVVNNTICDVPFPRGAIKVATNGGKTTISSFIHLSYDKPTVFLMNSKELYEQALKEIPEIIGQDRIGYISSKGVKFGKFMICMVQTLRNRLKDSKHVKTFMSQVQVLIVDEGDLADNKTNQVVIESLYNSTVRVALSGTIFVSKLAKDKIKNYNLEGFFGPLLYEVTNRELIDKGVSSEVEVTFVEGNTSKNSLGNYQSDYEEYLVKNKERNKRILKRSIFHATEKRTKQLIIAQRHSHIKRLYKRFKKAVDEGKIPGVKTVDWVHHDRKDRASVVEDFRTGKLDILIGSMILKRGKNFPKMQYMLNAGGGKSPENILQLLGRAFRGANYYEDMWDEGEYLKKHSRKRALYYKNEKIKVTNPFK